MALSSLNEQPTRDNEPMRFQGTFFDACTSRNLKAIRDLLAAGAPIDESAMVQCCLEGYLEVVQLLLENGASVESRVQLYGWKIRHTRSALYAACLTGNLEIVRLLLAHGARISALNGSPLYAACRYGHVEIVRLFLEKGASLKVSEGSLLAIAFKNKHIAVARLLMDVGMQIHNLADACAVGCIKTVRSLMEKGARPGPIEMNTACWHGQTEIVRLLLSSGVGIRLRNLMSACRSGHTDIVRLFLDNGAVPTTACLIEACWNNHTEIMRLLVEKGATCDEPTLRLGLTCTNPENVIILLQSNSNFEKQTYGEMISTTISRYEMLVGEEEHKTNAIYLYNYGGEDELAPHLTQQELDTVKRWAAEVVDTKPAMCIP